MAQQLGYSSRSVSSQPQTQGSGYYHSQQAYGNYPQQYDAVAPASAAPPYSNQQIPPRINQAAYPRVGYPEHANAKNLPPSKVETVEHPYNV